MTSPNNFLSPPLRSHVLYGGPDHGAPSARDVRVGLWDPDPVRAARLDAALQASGDVTLYPTLEQMNQACRHHMPAVVVLPLEGDGDPTGVSLAVLDFLRGCRRQTAALVYADTAHLPISLYSQPLAAGARQVLNAGSPAFLTQLQETVLRFLDNAAAQHREEEELTGLFARHGLIGGSPALRDVFRRVVKASQFGDLPVLILGPTGTGKQRLAEAIHRMDPCRNERPFITVNCSSINKTLAESELFGHTRGAFSGAQGDRQGLFRAANGGTLLLDEIGDLDPELQPKLLRVLQDQRLLPVGEDYEHPIDVRILAATNRPLQLLVEQGLFRQDLYQRLNVFRIVVPPLRERPEDVLLQAGHFLKRYQRTGHEPQVHTLSPQVQEALRALPWEGNTRQLENLVREVLAHREHRHGVLELDELPRWVFEHLAETPPPGPGPGGILEQLAEQVCAGLLSWDEAVGEYERLLLQRVLAETKGNRTHAAARLGLTPRTVFAKIKKYQLE